ncbi:MAG: GNAT family N-acetyltransferase [Anaerolineaceae bacterium]
MTDYSSAPLEGRADLQLVVEFARSNLASRLPGLTYWHPGDVVWRLATVEPMTLAANVRLWTDTDGIAGVAMFEPPLNVEFDLRADIPMDGSLLGEMLAWAEHRRLRLLHRAAADVPIAYSMLGNDTLATTALDSDGTRIAALAARAYSRVERHSMRYRRSLDTPIPERDLPAGARLRHVTAADVDERIDLHRDAWSVWGPSSATVEAYRKLRKSPVYCQELDVILEDSDGRFLSYCICWADEETGVGVFEPVGTRPSAAGQGYGRTVLFEGMRRLKAMGMHTALIGTASVNARALRLYPYCGFQEVDREHYYVKQLG